MEWKNPVPFHKAFLHRTENIKNPPALSRRIFYDEGVHSPLIYAA